MDCHFISNKLIVYLDGETPHSETAMLEDHLVSCKECAKELKSLQGMNSLLDRMPSMPAPRNFARETVKRAVSLKERQYNLADWWRTVTFAWKAAACTVALAGIIIGGALAKQPFGRVAPTTSVQKALFADNEPSLSKTYTTIVIAGR